MYWHARRQLGPALALVVAGVYFLYPPLEFVNLIDFHAIALATPLIAFALYFLLARLNLPFVVCLFLALSTKEQVSIIAVGLGVYVMVVQRQKALGLGLTCFCAAWAAALLLFVIPSFSDASFGSQYFFVNRYAYLGPSLGDIARTILTDPGLVVEHLAVPAKFEFVLQLLVHLAFVPLGGAEILALALPSLG